MAKEFYSMRLVPDDKGLCIVVTTLTSIHETPCYHYCVDEYGLSQLKAGRGAKGDTELQKAKTLRCRIRRVSKFGSRVAQETREEAYEKLRWLKHRQIAHMEREMEFIKRFLDHPDGLGSLKEDKATFNSCQSDGYLVPDTQNLVRDHLVFY